MGHEVAVIFPEHHKTREELFKTHEIIFSNGENKDADLPFNFPCFTSHPRSNNTFYRLSDNQIKAYVSKFEEAVDEEIKEFKPDLIHAQHLWITPYISSKTGLKYVATVHGTDLKGFKLDSRYHTYALEGAARAAKIITISKEVDKETGTLYNISDDKRIMIFNGYDNQMFHLQEVDQHEILNKFGIHAHANNIVTFAGKLTHFKGVDVLLKAAKLYEERLSGDVVTVIAGNGELYGDLMKLKKKLNLKNVHLIGHLSQIELAKLYNISDVNVVPSRNEPFGLVAIEAMACGAPVVGTNQGGLKDIVTREVGKLVPVDDDLALAEAIMSELLLKKSPQRRENVNKYVGEMFSLKKAVEQIVKVYEEIL
jgi:glycosyltransferase involved in cell wall biosynthesis